MKVAVVYNRESKSVINLFGMPNRERYGLRAVKRIVDSLKKGGHRVISLEGDKDLVDRLEDFMPQVLKGERPGIVFNISYGIQGQARYTHVPSILEMVGIPYVGSGPLAHSLSLDKVIAKMMFKQQGISTPPFAVLDGPDFEKPKLRFPLIVKPKNEAVSMGLKIVRNEAQLREAADVIFKNFNQPVLAERYIEGREINVGILGNDPPEVFVPAEVIIKGEGPNIYTFEDKTQKSGREVVVECPAKIDAETAAMAQDLALQSFKTLGCYDCARVDLRMDKNGKLYVLEVNSLPSLGEHGSYVQAAEYMGLDFPALVNRMVEVAIARYFGTPSPPQLKVKIKDPEAEAFHYITTNRDRIERRVQNWLSVYSRTEDAIGIQRAQGKLNDSLTELGLKQAKPYYGEPHVFAWETSAGMQGGTLIVGSLDIPRGPIRSKIPFSKDPEWFYGEGSGGSRAGIVMVEYALKALRHVKKLNQIPLGILYFTDLGMDCRYSAETIRAAMESSKRILVMRPGNPTNNIITQRRGQRKYLLAVEGKRLRLGHSTRNTEVIQWVLEKLQKINALTSRPKKVAVSATEIITEAIPMLLPHRITATIYMSYLDLKTANATEESMREIIAGSGLPATLTLVTDRPPMKKRGVNKRLIKQLQDVAEHWGIHLGEASSLWPSVAGLAPAKVPVVCGLAPVARELNTFRESVNRVSIIQRTVLLAEYLLGLPG